MSLQIGASYYDEHGVDLGGHLITLIVPIGATRVVIWDEYGAINAKDGKITEFSPDSDARVPADVEGK